MLLQRKAFILSAIVSAVLIGCGSSGNNNSSSNASTSLKGQFVDAPVENLDYKIGNQTGATDNDGYFTYNSSDENITFYVGDLKLGTFELKNIHNGIVFPADLVGVDINNTTNDNLIKIIRFLQSIDNDNNPDNGIYITDNIKTQINNLLENNSTYNPNFLDNNITVIKSLVESLNKKFVLEREARNNYAATLKKLGYTPTKMPFITVWEVNSTDKNITIPINPNYAGEYNYTVDWGDGNISKDVNDSITHTYSKEGNYTVKISGEFPAIYLNCNWNNDEIIADAEWGSWPMVIIGYSYIGSYLERLIEIQKWGDIEWKSFHHAFAGATNLKIESTDTPNLKNVKDMSAAFLRVNRMPDNLGDWNVSSVEDMSYMFMGLQLTPSLYPKNKKGISKWDVSNVKNMKYMFVYNYDFNVNLNEWNVSNVTNMKGMFAHATAFNQPLDKWDVSNVTNMNNMFCDATSFNQPLNDWNVSNVTDMYSMFEGGFFGSKPMKFNQPLNNWDVSNVTDMSYMFAGATSFDQNISMWDVSNVQSYYDFATNSPIDNTDKMPHFK